MQTFRHQSMQTDMNNEIPKPTAMATDTISTPAPKLTGSEKVMALRRSENLIVVNKGTPIPLSATIPPDEDCNRVFVRGRISGFYKGKELSYLFLKVKNYRKRPTEDGLTEDTVKVTLFEPLSFIIAKQFENKELHKRDRVEVIGLMQSINDRRHGRWSCEFRAIEIKKESLLLERYTNGAIRGDYHQPDENMVILKGKGTDFFVFPSSANSRYDRFSISIHTNVPKAEILAMDKRKKLVYYRSSNQISCFSDDIKSVEEKLTATNGKCILAIGSLSSVEHKDVHTGKSILFPRINVQEFRILSADEEKGLTLSCPVLS